MASIEKDKEREFIIECIRLYHSLPALWKVKSKEYYDRAKKKWSYEVLLKKYREWYPKATQDDLKKKFNSLRSNYRKEIRKQMEHNAQYGNSSDSVFETKLWYFNEINFLQENEKAEDSESSMDVSLGYTSVCSAEPLKVKYEETVEDDCEDEEHLEALSTSADDIDDCREKNCNTPRRNLKRPAPKKTKTENQPTNDADDIKDKRDEFFYWAMSCAEDLRQMSLTQQLYAKKAITEILMEGRLGQLHRNSVKINESLSEK